MYQVPKKGAHSDHQQHRMLQRPDETCWTDDPDNDDRFCAVPCTPPALLANWNNVPACAASQNDAVNFGFAFCRTWTTWNKEEPDCAYQYTCC